MKVEIGQFWRSGPRQRRFEVVGFECGERVILRRAGTTKTILTRTLKSNYDLVGSEREQNNIKAFKARGWQVADDA